MKKRKPNPYRPLTIYTLHDELMASDNKPLPQAQRTHHLSKMHLALHAMERMDAPTVNDWRLLSDAVEMMHALVTQGELQERNADGRTIASHWRGCRGEIIAVRDSAGLIDDAMQALGEAGGHHLQGKNLRLSGKGLEAVRNVLNDYTEAINTLPARTMIRCHRRCASSTQQRIFKNLPVPRMVLAQALAQAW